MIPTVSRLYKILLPHRHNYYDILLKNNLIIQIFKHKFKVLQKNVGKQCKGGRFYVLNVTLCFEILALPTHVSKYLFLIKYQSYNIIGLNIWIGVPYLFHTRVYRSYHSLWEIT